MTFYFLLAGKPEPTVEWYVNGKLKNDASDEKKTAGDIIEKKYVYLKYLVHEATHLHSRMYIMPILSHFL